MQTPQLILFLGADWWGSDARALAVSLRKLGHNLIEVNYETYFPQSWSSLKLKIARRLLRGVCEREFNKAVAAHASNTAIDFVLVFKGMLLKPETLRRFSDRGVALYCFYPDVSFADHGANIATCLPMYDCVFTTKRFHNQSTEATAAVWHIEQVSHGFDPDVHRTVHASDRVRKFYECDVSFVGCWSPKKEASIQAIIERNADLTLCVWGTGWQRAGVLVRRAWQRRGAFGDELAIIYNNSRINLGLLSERGSDTESGDEVTARTWQIPASGGFLLHESTAELAEYFIPGHDVGTFDNAADLPAKVEYYLSHAEERERVAAAGHRRCMTSNYTYSEAADVICRYYESSWPSGKQ